MSSSLDLPNDPLLGDALFNYIQVFGDLVKAVVHNPALVKLLEIILPLCSVTSSQIVAMSLSRTHGVHLWAIASGCC
jgi:hypothetical protein